MFSSQIHMLRKDLLTQLVWSMVHSPTLIGDTKDMMFWSTAGEQVGERFRRRGNSHQVYVVERIIEPADHSKHASRGSRASRDALTVALSALLDDRSFERVGS